MNHGEEVGERFSGPCPRARDNVFAFLKPNRSQNGQNPLITVPIARVKHSHESYDGTVQTLTPYICHTVRVQNAIQDVLSTSEWVWTDSIDVRENGQISPFACGSFIGEGSYHCQRDALGLHGCRVAQPPLRESSQKARIQTHHLKRRDSFFGPFDLNLYVSHGLRWQPSWKTLFYGKENTNSGRAV